jgi:K+-sensing histidine kinase KdpD
MPDGLAPRRCLSVRTAVTGQDVHVTVSDRGPGIPAEDLERIFEPFVSSRPDGMGLGLAVCRTIVHAHGGALWADNDSESGARFSLYTAACGRRNQEPGVPPLPIPSSHGSAVRTTSSRLTGATRSFMLS